MDQTQPPTDNIVPTIEHQVLNPIDSSVQPSAPVPVDTEMLDTERVDAQVESPVLINEVNETQEVADPEMGLDQPQTETENIVIPQATEPQPIASQEVIQGEQPTTLPTEVAAPLQPEVPVELNAEATLLSSAAPGQQESSIQQSEVTQVIYVDAGQQEAPAQDQSVNDTTSQQQRPLSTYGGKGLFGQITQQTQKNQLITINLDTYQAARLNSILSQISLNSAKTFRIDPYEKVEGEIKRKEGLEKKESARIIREQKRLRQQRERDDEKQRQKEVNRQQMEQYSIKFKNAQRMHTNAPQSNMNPAQQLITSQNSQLNGDDSKHLMALAQSTPAKMFMQNENAEINVDKVGIDGMPNDPESNIFEGASYKPKSDMKLESMTDPVGLENADGEIKDVVLGQGFPNNDTRGLSPITRRSDRARADISYSALNSGKPTTDEAELQALGQLGTGFIANPVSQTKDQSKSKSKSQISTDPHHATKKGNTSDTQKKIEDMLERLKRSQHAHLFNQPISRDEPLYERYKSNQKTLSFIELNLKMGQYTNTNQIGQDIRKNVACRMEIAMSSGDQDQNLQIQEFLSEFDQCFQGLDNLALGKSQDHPNSSTNQKPGSTVKPTKPSGGRQTSTGGGQGVQNQKAPSKPSKTTQGSSQPTGTDRQASAGGGLNGQAASAGGVAASGSVVIETTEPAMSPEEVSQLKMKIDTQLTPEQKKGILPIIKEEALQQQQEHQARGVQQANGSTTFEFQLDKLTPKTARQLEAYVNQQVATNKKKQKRKETDAARRRKAQVAKQEQQRQREALAAQQKARDSQMNPQGIQYAANQNAAAKNMLLQQNQPPIQGVPLAQNQAAALQQFQMGLQPQQMNAQQLQNLLAAQNQKGQAPNPQLLQQLAAVGNGVQNMASQQALLQMVQANAQAQNIQQANIQKQVELAAGKNQGQSQMSGKEKGDDAYDSDSSSSSDE